MLTKTKSKESRIKLRETAPAARSGGESRPFDYPHLYKIQAGDWRISYAVEHNRLAILVLEVLTPEGAAKADPVHEQMTKKMKIKLLDLPEVIATEEIKPEDVGKKIKIKLLDIPKVPAEAEPAPAADAQVLRIKFPHASAEKAGEAPDLSQGAKVTPLDAPSE
jgi:mRNA-degrading endonuclease RelE of RelBE toxin-antitoxin system